MPLSGALHLIPITTLEIHVQEVNNELEIPTEERCDKSVNK